MMWKKYDVEKGMMWKKARCGKRYDVEKGTMWKKV